MSIAGRGVVVEAARSKRGKMEARLKRRLNLYWGLGEVAMGVLDEVEGVVRAAQSRLQVAQQRVDHVIDAKDNFEFERRVGLCRTLSLLDFRRKR